MRIESSRSWLGAALLAFLLTGCGGGDAVNCTDEANQSLVVTVTDVRGEVLADYDIKYTLDGEPKDEFCLGFSCSPHPFEVSGDFEVTASKPGYITNSVAVTVKRDECHVITEQVLIVLQEAE